MDEWGGDGIEDLGAEVRAAIARIYSRFRSERAEGELGDAALLVLSQLQKNGPLTLTELSERSHVTPGSMSQTINRLAASGYLGRDRDPQDRRRVLLVLTPAGTEIAIAARNRRTSWFDARLAELGDDERAALAVAAAVLRKMADS